MQAKWKQWAAKLMAGVMVFTLAEPLAMANGSSAACAMVIEEEDDSTTDGTDQSGWAGLVNWLTWDFWKEWEKNTLDSNAETGEGSAEPADVKTEESGGTQDDDSKKMDVGQAKDDGGDWIDEYWEGEEAKEVPAENWDELEEDQHKEMTSADIAASDLGSLEWDNSSENTTKEAFAKSLDGFKDGLETDEYKSYLKAAVTPTTANAQDAQDTPDYYWYYPEDVNSEKTSPDVEGYLSADPGSGKMPRTDGTIDGEQIGYTDSEIESEEKNSAIYDYGDDYINDEISKESLEEMMSADEEEGIDLGDQINEPAYFDSVHIKKTLQPFAYGDEDYYASMQNDVIKPKGTKVPFAEVKTSASAKSPTRAQLMASDKNGFFKYWANGESKFFYNQMSRAEKAAYDKMFVECMLYLAGRTKSRKTSSMVVINNSITSKELTLKQLKHVRNAFYMSNPQFYFLRTRYTFSENRGVRAINLGIYQKFQKGAGAATMQKAIESARKAYHVNGWAKASQEERASAIHNWIAQHVDYDYFGMSGGNNKYRQKSGRPQSEASEEVAFTQSAYSVFAPKADNYYRFYSSGVRRNDIKTQKYFTVCAGYAKGFALLCQMDGIEAICLNGHGHQWNLVHPKTFKNKKRNSWYMVDCCWDDKGAWKDYPLAYTCDWFMRSTKWCAKHEQAKNSSGHAMYGIWERYKPYTTAPEEAPLPSIVFTLNNKWVPSNKKGAKHIDKYMYWSYQTFHSAANKKMRYRYVNKQFKQDPNGNYVCIDVKKNGKTYQEYYRVTSVMDAAGCYRNNGAKDYAWTRHIDTSPASKNQDSDEVQDSEWMKDPVDGAGIVQEEAAAANNTQNAANPAQPSGSSTSGSSAVASLGSSSAVASLGSSSGGGSGSGDSGKFSSKGDVRITGKGSQKACYEKTGKNTVAYSAASLSFKAKKATIPATIKIGKKVYKVTAIRKDAFLAYDKLEEVVVGKNIKKIGQRAFGGAARLKTLTIRSKNLTKKDVKGALSESSVRKIKAPEGKIEAYRKIFTKKNAGSKQPVKVGKQ